MCGVWLNQLNNGSSFKRFEGKGYKAHSFTSFASLILVLDAYVLLGFACYGFCDEVPMVSVPLGFEVSGFETSTTWVSQNRVFAFGFLGDFLKDMNDDNGDGFIVGISYNLGNIKAANLPVWTVGGGLKVSENSTFGLSEDGRLVLFENPNALIVWSSNTSNLGVQKASLLDNGNLVLLGSRDEVLWQSFNSPTSTLLPGQSFHFPQSLRAPSTKSISSYYNFVIRRSGELALVWESNVTYWQSGYPSAVNVKEARFDSDGVLGLFDDANRSIWSVTSKDFEDSYVTLRHLRIDSDGNVRIYSWDSTLRMWKVGWQAVENQCEVFGSCGLYSLCGFNSSGPVCNCLYDGSTDGDTGTPGIDLGVSGCKKLVDLGNCRQRTSMMVLKHTVLYSLYPPHDTSIMSNENDCKEYCSNDTSCIAVTSKNDGSGLCTVKRTSFVSGYSDPSLTAVSFLKVCLVPQAVSAQKANPRGQLEPNPLLSGRVIAQRNGNKFVVALALIGLTTALGSLTVEILVFWFVYRRRSTAKRRDPFEKAAELNPNYSAPIRLSFEEIEDLTCNFATQLGPSIFKGVLLNKIPIIVKLLSDVVVSEKDFRAAISVLGGTHHRNLVTLKGFCYDQMHRVLIYEYIPYGSLEKWLFDEEGHPKEQHWQERLDIALGVARGLAYLHLECQNCIPHGNLKLENVMLDNMLAPKLMDFGLHSFLEKEAANSSESGSEKDIYKFGLMLLQIVTRKRDPPGDDDLNHLVDDIIGTQRLERCEEYERVERVVKIALWCMQNQPFLRPSIGEVVKVLEGTFSVDRPPSSFAFGSVHQVESHQISREIEEEQQLN